MIKKQTIDLAGRVISYELKKNWRQKNIRLRVLPGGELRVSAPRLVADSYIKIILRQKSAWLFKKMAAAREKKPAAFLPEHDFFIKREEAREFINARLTEINQVYNFSYNKVFIRNQKTRWGSCSRNKNLNFNYKIIFLPPRLADYIITHELCHLAELNHSFGFWQLVSRMIPDYQQRRKALRNFYF